MYFQTCEVFHPLNTHWEDLKHALWYVGYLLVGRESVRYIECLKVSV